MTEQTSTETAETTVETKVEAQVETQQDLTQEPAVETTIPANTSAETVGIVKEEKAEDGDSQAESAPNLNDLVAKALKEGITQAEQDQLEESGMADNFNLIIEGHRSRQEATDKEIQSVVGGEKEYRELIEFAKSNFNEAEVNAFNHAVLESGNIDVAKLAVEGLKARYVAQNGSEPSKVIQAGGGGTQVTDAFDNVNEYLQETRTLKYKQDPEHRQQVEAKRAKAGF